MIPERIEREIVIEASPERVWAVLTEPEHVGVWFAESVEGDLRPGTASVLTWEEHGSFNIQVEKSEPPRYFAFRWAARSPGRRPGRGQLDARRVPAHPGSRRHAPARGRERLPRSPRRAGGVRARQHAGLGRSARQPAASTWRRRPRHRPGDDRPRRGAGRALGCDRRAGAQALLDLLLARGEATATTLAARAADLAAGSRQAPRGPRPHRPRRGPAAGPRGALLGPPERLDAASRRLAEVAAGWDARLATIKRLAESPPK